MVAATESFNFNADIFIPLGFDVEVSPTVKYRWGWDVAGFIEFFGGSPVSLLTEVHYIQKGYVTTIYYLNTDRSSRVDYLSAPILAKVQFAEGTIGPFVCAGPRFDFLLGKQNSLDYSSTDIGMSLGAGLQVSLPWAPPVSIEDRFSPAFTDAFHNPNLTVKNQSFEVLVGAAF